MSYFNTTNETGAKLAQYNSKALTQDEAILAYFKSYDNLGATPERVLRHLQIMEKLSSNRWSQTPIVSIRRAFSNLKRKGLIYKTDMMIKGDYGKPVTVWKLCK